MVPSRDPTAVGVKIMENAQLPAACTLFPQLSVSAKSPVVVIDEIASGALPMLRRRIVCGWLLEPTVWLAYCKAAGLKVTAGADVAAILRMKASVFPPNTLWNADCVIGKSLRSEERRLGKEGR